jgi:hypothetical protein
MPKRWLVPIMVLLTGCAGGDGAGCPAGKPMQVYQLYFGRSIKGGGFVADWDWNAFRDSAITPNMPDGFTIVDADGAWAAPDGRRTVTDRTKVPIAAMPGGPGSLAVANRVREAYRRRFSQDLVGMIVQPGCASF